MITGAQAVVDCLRREGIDHVFGIPGTMNLPILDVLRATPEIRFVLTRHEQGAAFMAYGFARSLNRPAIVTATEGPGVTNLTTGIGAAYKGYVPIISISGAQELWVREKDASQDIDQVTMNRPITKWAYSIPAVTKIQEAVRRAFRVALSEPLGPVHLDVSKDILLEHVEPEPIAAAAYRPSSLPSCSSNELDRAAALIAQAKRPILLAGGGVLRENALGALQSLAEATGIPVATLQYHPDAFPTTHALALGPLGRNGWSSANRAMPEADVVIALGAHIFLISSTFKHGIICRYANLDHVQPAVREGREARAAEAADDVGGRRHGHDVQHRRAGDRGARAHRVRLRGVQRLRPGQRARFPEGALRRAHLRRRLRRRRLRRARAR